MEVQRSTKASWLCVPSAVGRSTLQTRGEGISLQLTASRSVHTGVVVFKEVYCTSRSMEGRTRELFWPAALTMF